MLDALCLSLQFSLTSEIQRFNSARPRFPDAIKASETMLHLALTDEFFVQATAVPTAITEAGSAGAQLLVSVLGAMHAVGNPLSPWESVKAVFAFLGHRKGRLTPKLNQRISDTLSSVSGPGVAMVLKEHVLQRSAQVKAGVRAVVKIRGPHATAASQKSRQLRFDNGFGQGELARLAGAEQNLEGAMVDLTELKPDSVAFSSGAYESHVETWSAGQKRTEELEKGARAMLSSMVSPED